MRWAFFISVITGVSVCVALLYATFHSLMLPAQRLKYVMINKQKISLAHCGLKKMSCIGLFRCFRWWCKHDYYRCKPHFFWLKTVLGHCVIVQRCKNLPYLSIMANQMRLHCSTFIDLVVVWCRTRHRISLILGPWLNRQVFSCVLKHWPWLTELRTPSNQRLWLTHCEWHDVAVKDLKGPKQIPDLIKLTLRFNKHSQVTCVWNVFAEPCLETDALLIHESSRALSSISVDDKAGSSQMISNVLISSQQWQQWIGEVTHISSPDRFIMTQFAHAFGGN